MKQLLVITELTRAIGLSGRRTVWGAIEFEDYFPFPLTAESFTTGQSDNDAPSDEIYCPCGETLWWDWPHSIGDAMVIVQEHIREHSR